MIDPSEICQRLIGQRWLRYTGALENTPNKEGIYVIGVKPATGRVKYLYVGHSVDIHRRLLQHRNQSLKIDHFIQRQYRRNGGKNLRVKWEEKKNSKLKEGKYIQCIESILRKRYKRRYKLRYNLKRGNGN